MRLNPNDFAPYTWVGDAYLALGRVEEAKAIVHQAITQTPGGAFPCVELSKLAFLRGDANGMEEALAGLKTRAPAVDGLLAEVATFSGQIGAAGELRDLGGT